MLAGDDHAVAPAAGHDTPDDELFELEDPATLPPIASREDFTAIVDSLVADNAPRVFAVVHEYGDRVDAWIVAWGMAFDDHAEVVGVDGGVTTSLPAPQDALFWFAWDRYCTPRLVWVNPAASPEHSELT